MKKNICVVTSLLTVILVSIFSIAHQAQAEEEEKFNKRVITIGRDITSIANAIGRGKAIIAMDADSELPETKFRRAQIGKYNMINAKRIILSRPDMVIATSNAGPESEIEKVKKAGIKWYSIDAPYGYVGVIKKTVELGEILEADINGLQLTQQMFHECSVGVGMIMHVVKERAKKPRTIYLKLKPGSNDLYIAGYETPGHGFLDSAFARNAAKRIGVYPLKEADIDIADVQALVISTEDAVRLGGRGSILNHPYLRDAQAAKDSVLFIAPEKELTIFGADLCKITTKFAEKFISAKGENIEEVREMVYNQIIEKEQKIRQKGIKELERYKKEAQKHIR